MQLTLSSRRDIAVLQKESSALEGEEDVFGLAESDSSPRKSAEYREFCRIAATRAGLAAAGLAAAPALRKLVPIRFGFQFFRQLGHQLVQTR
jgi:hypothetical protein